VSRVISGEKVSQPNEGPGDHLGEKKSRLLITPVKGETLGEELEGGRGSGSKDDSVLVSPSPKVVQDSAEFTFKFPKLG